MYCRDNSIICHVEMTAAFLGGLNAMGICSPFLDIYVRSVHLEAGTSSALKDVVDFKLCAKITGAGEICSN